MRDASKLADDYIALWNETDQTRRLTLLGATWMTDASYVDPSCAVMVTRKSTA